MNVIVPEIYSSTCQSLSKASLWELLAQTTNEVWTFCRDAFLIALYLCMEYIYLNVLKPVLLFTVPLARYVFDTYLKFWLLTSLEPVIWLYFLGLQIVLIIMETLWDEFSPSTQWVLKMAMIPQLFLVYSVVKRRQYWKRRTEYDFKYLMWKLTDMHKTITTNQGYCIAEVLRLLVLHVKLYYRTLLFKFNETRLIVEYSVYHFMKLRYNWNLDFLRIRF